MADKRNQQGNESAADHINRVMHVCRNTPDADQCCQNKQDTPCTSPVRERYIRDGP